MIPEKHDKLKKLAFNKLHRILHEVLGLKAYKELKPADHHQRRVFADWVVEMHEKDPEFH